MEHCSYYLVIRTIKGRDLDIVVSDEFGGAVGEEKVLVIYIRRGLRDVYCKLSPMPRR